jgi:hypothetical protein
MTTATDFGNLDKATDADERRFVADFTKALASDAGEEAKRHLELAGDGRQRFHSAR